MKNLIINIVLIILVMLFAGLTFNQCSVKKSEREQKETALAGKAKSDADYIALVKAKTRIDTLYKQGETKYITKTDFKTTTDTLFIEGGKVYSLYLDSIRTPELTLDAKVTASDLKGIDYTYSVTQKIIHEQTILTEYDTLIQVIRKGQLIGLADIGLHSYSAGLQYQSRKRIGFTARYNWYRSDGWVSIGATYRIF